MRATTKAPSVKRIRLLSSLALPMEPKLKLAASCSAAEAIGCSFEKRADLIWGSGPALASGTNPYLCFARFALFGRFRAARLALARLALLVGIDLLLEGGGDAAAGLFDRFLGRGAGARHFDIDLGGDGALAEQ